MEGCKRTEEDDHKDVYPNYFSFSKSGPEFFTANAPVKYSSAYERQSKSGLICVVCGDVSSGKHYGVLACNGCSGFFKRSVRRKLVYRCQASGGDCLVDKTHRNQCQACRLKKCLECGMNKDAVQNERQPRTTATVGSESVFVPSLHYSDNPPTNSPTKDVTIGLLPSLIPLHHHNSTPLFSKLSTAKFTTAPFHRNVKSKSQESAASETLFHQTYSDLSNSVTRTSCSTRFEWPFDVSCNVFFDMSFRILLHSIQWAKTLPTFSSLTLNDQVALLEGTWFELFILNSIQWSIPLDSNPLFSPTDIPVATNINDCRKTLRDLNKIFIRFKTLGTNYTEFTCLRAIILFRPDVDALKDTHQIQLLQDHAQFMLAHHIKSEHFDFSFRFGRLLLLLPALRQIEPNVIENIFFCRTVNSTSVEELVKNMLKSI
ncbi:photoreceptor-specific nuclear receptor-like [Parasteatoda tepidariorum]|uniref:photoreceptor-specific nuclear receptor-like n=1 Tax=Parasteatoda tepidariorum TaxID=114398 RepID=UPI001C7205E2|nr:photoreceptor-specific nuclear receptor-like [Parasteatoda tepidariorum]